MNNENFEQEDKWQDLLELLDSVMDERDELYVIIKAISRLCEAVKEIEPSIADTEELMRRIR